LILEGPETARAVYNVIYEYDSIMTCYRDRLAAPGQLVDLGKQRTEKIASGDHAGRNMLSWICATVGALRKA